MELTLTSTRIRMGELSQALFGSLFIALGALVSIPTVPIPTTLQTFAIIIVALTQAPRVAFASLLMYLIEATIGLPVLAGKSNPLWLFGPTAGYLVAFPFAAYLISYLSRKTNNLYAQMGIIAGAQLLILLSGFARLTSFVPLEYAFKFGFLFFLPVGFIKNCIATRLSRLILNKR